MPSDSAQAGLLQTCFPSTRSSATRGLTFVPESPQHSARGSQDLSRCPPKCFQWEYNFWVEENVLIYNIYIFVFIPMQSYPCNINIFLGRKVPGRKIFPGGFGSQGCFHCPLPEKAPEAQRRAGVCPRLQSRCLVHLSRLKLLLHGTSRRCLLETISSGAGFSKPYVIVL